MASERLEEIKKIIEFAPQDPFPRYGLAMEHRTGGDHEEAVRAFADLQQRHPDYVPQYLMHGGSLVSLRRYAEARQVFAQGIEAAKRARNQQHALSELQAALDALDDQEQDER